MGSGDRACGLAVSGASLRGEARESGPVEADCAVVADILAVQSCAERDELSPMLVSYGGAGRPVDQALGLLRDARTLRDAVSAAETGGEERASTWQRAVDSHAFSVGALDHRILRNLPVDDAYEIATAAIRQAEALMLTPDGVVMPLLPVAKPSHGALKVNTGPFGETIANDIRPSARAAS